MKYIDALKKYNEGKDKWCFPRKGSVDYLNIIRMMKNIPKNKKDKLDPGVTSILNSILVDLTEKRKTVKLGDAKSIEAIKVNDNLLIDAFNNPEEVTNNEKIAILNLFLNAVQVKDFTSNMSAVAGLTNGLGKDIASVNEKADQIDKLFDKDAMMDLNPIYKSKTWQSKYLEIFNQIRNELLPATFLSASENFQAILTKVLDNVNSDSIEFTEETKAGSVELKLTRP